MPDPVFRSTEGHDPRVRRISQDDIPTDSPDVDTEEFDTDTPEHLEPGHAVAEASRNSVRAAPVERGSSTRQGKASGCLKTVGVIGGVLIIGALLLIAILVYLLFFYRPGETTF